MRVQSLGPEDPPEEGMATHSSILTWRIPWTEEPGRLQFIGSHRVGHNWSDLAHMHTLLMYYCSFLFMSVQFSSVAQSCWLFATPWTTARLASLSITKSWSSPKTMSIELVCVYMFRSSYIWCIYINKYNVLFLYSSLHYIISFFIFLYTFKYLFCLI